MSWSQFRPVAEPPEASASGESDEPADPEAVARTICLRLLDMRARTRAELAAELRRRAVPDEPAAAVLDRFAELGLVDDAAFAEAFAVARHTERGHAGRAIAVALRRRGVADEVIADAIAEHVDPASEAAAAVRLAQTKLARMGDVDAATVTRRLSGLLARRGYSASVTYAAIRTVLSEREDSGELPALDLP